MNEAEENNPEFMFKKSTFYLPQLADAVLADAKSCYNEKKQFTPQIIQQLHSIFPSILVEAFDIVDKYKFIKYRLTSNTRCIIKLRSRSNQFTLHEGIEFCTCTYFLEEVFKHQHAFICSHLLALKIAVILEIVQDEVISNSQLSNLLDNEMDSYLGFPGFNEDEL